MRKLYYFILFFAPTLLIASEAGEHHASVTDLIAPAINFCLLMGFLFYKLKKPISSHFTNKSEQVAQTLERVALKSQEAKSKLETQTNKLKKVDTEVEKILKSAEAEVIDFKKRYAAETQERISKMKEDAATRVAVEKNSMISQINRELIEKLVSKAKNKISSDSSLKNKVTTGILKELR